MPKPAQAEMTSAAQRENQRILGSYGGVYENARLQQMVDKLVARLVAASERPDIKYKVTILNSPAINAFALPNGQLYVTRGLIALANDEAELASVLAHEMGHVIARHAQIARGAGARRGACQPHPQRRGERPADERAGAGQVEAGAGRPSRARRNSRPTASASASARAPGSIPTAPRACSPTCSAMPTSMRAAATPAPSTSFPTIRRRRSASATSSPTRAGSPDPASASATATNTSPIINGAVYGEDPSEGFVRGRRFIHSKLGFTFLAPPGFTLDNTAQAVLGLKDGGVEALRLDVVSVPAEQSLTDYLNSGWIEHVERASLEDFTLNGFPAATATATGKDWSFRLFVVRFGSDVYRFIFAAKHMTPQIDATFKQSIDTFRRMSLKEAAEVKPLHLKIVSVGPHDTVASLARRMALPDHRVERFRMLNGLGAARTR